MAGTKHHDYDGYVSTFWSVLSSAFGHVPLTPKRCSTPLKSKHPNCHPERSPARFFLPPVLEARDAVRDLLFFDLSKLEFFSCTQHSGPCISSTNLLKKSFRHKIT